MGKDAPEPGAIRNPEFGKVITCRKAVFTVGTKGVQVEFVPVEADLRWRP